MIDLWDNKSEANRCVNTEWPLTHSLDQSEEGLAVKATRKCSVEGCESPVECRSVCKAHYGRLLRHGSPTAGRASSRTGCAVEGCERPHRGRGLCDLHLQRMVRNGTTEAVRFKPRSCSIEGCGRPHSGRGWCALHYQRWARAGDPTTVRINPAILPGNQNCKWRGSEVGYTAAHDRVRKALGSASEKKCVDCGKPATGWSYDHLDPDERVGTDDPKQMPYSTKAEHYQARCDSCHWHIDHPTGKVTRA